MSRDEHGQTRELFERTVAEAIAVCRRLLDDQLVETAERVTDEIVGSLRAGGKVLLCGNGGSAADAQHLAAELIGRFCLDRRALAAVALGDNVAAMTAIGNDYAFEEVFVRGVDGLGRAGDVLIGLSSSGNSANVVAALQAAREAGLITVAFVGRPECAMAAHATHLLPVSGPGTARIQEGHMLLGHTIFEAVERRLCDAP
jgi:D-sedoheptulose 7-phosphate isomerase